MTRPAAQQQSTVFPMEGETQSQFFDRAWRALKQSIPKPNSRTQQIIRIWQQSGGDQDLRDTAHERFSEDRFTHYGPRCIFLSHTIPEIAEERDENDQVTQPGREGTVYDRKNLQKLVDYANYRIRNADQFAALSEGHMPTSDEKKAGQGDAEVLGYAGPFYIGLFGNENPQWSIWCDEWVHNEDVSKAEKLQRRSPEIWCKEPIERRTMDPIAMLGSETPRLDSGMNLYAKRADGQLVMRYSMGMSMALPGADNSYVPGSETGHKTKYGADEMAFPGHDDGQQPQGQPGADPSGGQGGPVSVDMVAQVLAQMMPAITDAVFKIINQNNPTDDDAVPQDGMDGGPGQDGEDDIPRGIDAPEGQDQSGQATAKPQAPPQHPSAQTPPPSPKPVPPSGPPQGGSPSPHGGAPGGMPGGPPGGDAPNPQAPQSTPAKSHIDDKHAQYAAMSPDCGNAYAAGYSACSMKGNRPMTENYSKIEELQRELAACRTRINDLEQDKRDVTLYAKIHSIAAEHEIGDEAEHMAACIDMDDDGVEKYCKALSYAPKKGDVTNVDLYDDPNFDQTEPERYSRGGRSAGRQPTKQDVDRYQREAADLTVRKRSKGVTTDFETEFNTILLANGFPAAS